MVCSDRVFATYVHNLDPVALPIWGILSVKWYGLAYLMGFVAGFFLLRNLARRKLWVLPPEKVGDFIAAAALFGVFLGGRLGSILFYQLRESGWGILRDDPWMVLRVWEGGMSSHGGILGLIIFTFFYARKHKVTWTGLGDGLCVVAPVGLFFGRIANFVNGELYGRVTDGVSWAVKFPLSINEEAPEIWNAARYSCIQVEPKLADGNFPDNAIAAARDNPEVRETLGEFLPTRHPSQIYEALLEGAALFAILWIVRTRFPKAPDGLLTGLFFALYASFRIFGEQFREPDAAMFSFLTAGQFYSIPMFLFAAGFLAHAWRGWKRTGNV